VLAVDDDPQERQMLSETLSSLGYMVETASNGEEALNKLDVTSVSAIVTDLMMPRLDGFQLLRTLLQRGQSIPAIVLTGVGDIADAVSVVHELRAFWYLEKPAQPAVLETLLERAIQYGSLVQETERLQRQLSYQGVLGDMIGSSAPMQQVYSLTQRVAPTQASVLITGESGTGKEMVARTIHKLSPRARNAFVALNCAALPENLIESELFGHERGAFTGAIGRHAGAFEQATGGTLFLDEIGDMPPAMQVRLLRVLEDSKVRRLGSTSEITVDVRVLAATNRSVAESIESKSLREDLYYRLNVFHIHLPPLRERKDDIPLLSKAMVDDLARKHGYAAKTLDSTTLERLMAHAWPGNVRELRNALEWAIITAGADIILPGHLPKFVGCPQTESAAMRVTESAPRLEAGKKLSELEQDYIALTLKYTNNDRKAAARLLGISLRTLCTRLADLRSQTASVGTDPRSH
jgi:DNA-binding NtrC family response regulator